MTYDAEHRMHDTPILTTSNLGLIVLNFILGFAGNDIVNALVAFTGLFITLLANVQRMAMGFFWFRDMIRAGWKIPANEPPATAPKDDVKEN